MKEKSTLGGPVALRNHAKTRGASTSVPPSAFRDRMIESLSFCHAVFLHLEEMENSLSYPKECPRP